MLVISSACPSAPRLRPSAYGRQASLLAASIVAVLGVFLVPGGSAVVWLAAIWGVRVTWLLPGDPAAGAVQVVLVGSVLATLAVAWLLPGHSVFTGNMVALSAGLMVFQLGAGVVGVLWPGKRPTTAC